MYKIVNNPITDKPSCVQRIFDNAFIPFDPANTDYQAYLKWLAEGNTPIAADEQIPEGEAQ